MPVQQSSQTFTPNEAAIMVGTAAHNVRRWTEYHSAHLSPLATPPPGQARRYNGRDVEVLKHVKALRSQGLTVPVINEQLSGLTFAEIDTSSLGILPVTDSEELAPLASQEGLQSTPAMLVVLNDLEKRIDAKFDALQQSRRDNVTWFGLGFLVAGFLFLGMVLLSWLYGG